MIARSSFRSLLPVVAATLVIECPGAALAQRQTITLGEGPWSFDTYEPDTRIKVTVLARPLSHPWSLAFLPNGDILVTERAGRLRLVRDGKLLPDPVADMPEVSSAPLAGLLDLALHPDFAQNGLVYFSYSKPIGDVVANALGRGRWTGARLVDIEDVFVTDDYGERRGGAARILFDTDSTLFMTSGGAGQEGDRRSQDLRTDVGKLLRLRDDGGVPEDNPFVGVAGARPEIYSYGHRNQLGLALNPETGALFAAEQGPQGGDEINIIEPGGNYGWPIVTYGRNYDGTRASKQPWREEFIGPQIFWVPSIAASGMTFYSGDAFPAWKGNLFVGGMVEARIPQTGQIQRIVFNENGEIRRESLLRELRQRIRDVRQGSDGLLYALTEETDGALLRIEPAP
jgi:glucose/arabinose dehydrogenase